MDEGDLVEQICKGVEFKAVGDIRAEREKEAMPITAPQARVKRTKEVEDEVLERLAQGESMVSIASYPHLPSQTAFYEWLLLDNNLAERYARAREAQAEVMVEEILEIADDGRNDWMETNGQDSVGWQLNGEHIQRSKVRIDSRKWIAAKLKPKKYGDSIKVETETTLKAEEVSLDPEKLLSTAEYIISSCLDLTALEGLKLKLDDVVMRKRSEGAKIING